MLTRAGSGESARDTNDVAVGHLELFGQIDLVACRFLQKLNLGELVAYLDECSGSGMEGSHSRDVGPGQGNAAQGHAESHCDSMKMRIYEQSVHDDGYEASSQRGWRFRTFMGWIVIGQSSLRASGTSLPAFQRLPYTSCENRTAVHNLHETTVYGISVDRLF